MSFNNYSVLGACACGNPASIRAMANQIIPVYGAPGYDTLTSAYPTGAGYFTISTGYANCQQDCVRFAPRSYDACACTQRNIITVPSCANAATVTENIYIVP